MVSKFFDWINRPIIQNYYIKDLQNWEAICASLHLINDLQRPKDEYYTLNSINYLETIGIMQTLYIEQDCIQTLRNALLENKQKGFNNYSKIREIRNEVIGHPSDKQYKSLKTRHFFDIKDNNKQIIKTLSWGTEEDIRSKEIIISELVLENSKITFEYLLDLENQLTVKFNEIMKKNTINFDTLFQNVEYTFDKLLHKEHDEFVIESYKDTVDKEIEKVKIGLSERNIYENYEKDIQVIEFFNSKLKPLFYEQTFNDIEFYSYLITLIENIRKLRDDLKKVDTQLKLSENCNSKTL